MKRPAATLLFVALATAPLFAQAGGSGTTGGQGQAGSPAPAQAEGPGGPSAQPAPAEAQSQAGAPAASAAGSGASEKGKPPPTAAELLQETVGLDIDTASYYELVAWCQRLGLSTAGTKSDLQQRLRDHYKVTPAAAAAAGAEKGTERTITIESADSTRYFTLERVKQKYIRLTGKVELRMYDPKTGDTHTIRADTILFNEEQKSITASGHVEYDLTGKGKTETFRGESLTFDVDTWAGIFFSGTSQSQKQINKNTITFYFSGKEIRRSSKDVVTMNDGTITTTEEANPDFKIEASRIWVLAPGEWALANAVLYVGRVPLLYFPGFFHPGDNLLFHPSFGFRPEEGYFLQTTTYLLGRRPKSASSLSFLQIAEDTNETYNTQVHGLFLRKTTAVTSSELAAYPYDAQTSYVKLLADAYSRLGFFGGVEAKLAGFGLLKDSDLDLAIARSRNIYIDPNTGLYSAFLQNLDGTFSDSWNTSYLGGGVVPFRYGFNADFNLQGSTFQVTASLPFYSDPYFVRDFGNREEIVDWSQLLGINSVNQQQQIQTLRSQLMSSLQWTLHTQFTPNMGALKPFVSTLSITAADLQMYWQTKPTYPSPIPSLLPNGYTAGDFYYPNQSFFYPTTYVTPNFSAQISGTLLGAAPGTTAQAPTPAQPGLTQKPVPAASPQAGAGAAASQTPASSPSAAQAGAAQQGAQAGASGAPSGASQGPIAGAAKTAASPAGQAAPALPAGSAGNLTPPWQTPKAKEGAAPQESVRLPELRGDIPITAPVTPSTYTQSLTYSLVPNLSVQNTTVSTNWNSPADINFGSAYSVLTTQGTGTLQYNGALFGTLAGISNAVTFTGNYKTHFNEQPAVASQWQSFLLQDYASSFLKVTDALSITTMPFLGNPTFGNSQLTYSLTADLFDRTFVPGSLTPSFQNTFLAWDPNHISAHSIDLALKALPSWGQQQSLTINTILPPLIPEVDTTGVFPTGFVTTTLSSSVFQPVTTEGWQPKTAEANVAFSTWFNVDQLLTYDYTVPAWTTSTSRATFSAFDSNLSLQESFTYDLRNHLPLDSTTKLSLWFFTAQFEAQQTYPYQFLASSGWVQQPTQAFIPSNFSAGVNYSYTSPPLWKNRILWSTSVAANWNINLLRFTENLLDFKFSTTLSIYKFLDLTFSAETTNAATYRYIPGLPEQIGQSQLSPFSDLVDSFNFFSTAARSRSNFKMKSVSLSLVHHLGDWDLSVQYTGSPQLVYASNGTTSYQWTPTLSIAVQWKPVPELKSNIAYQQGTLSY